MELKLLRGVAADLTPADPKGRVVCRVGERTVRLHRDLSNVATAGDDVLIGGELHEDVVHAVVLKNFTHRKLGKVDFTFHILGAGLGGYLVSMGLYFASETTAETLSGEHALAFLLLSVGAAIVFFPLRRVLRINKLTRWVDGVSE